MRAENKRHLQQALRHIHFAQGHLRQVEYLLVWGGAMSALENAEDSVVGMLEANERTVEHVK